MIELLRSWKKARTELFELRSHPDFLEHSNDEEVIRALEKCVDIADAILANIAPKLSYRPNGDPT